MAILRMEEIRKMSPEDRLKNLNDLNLRKLKFNARVASGGDIENPGEIRELKRAIARIKTVIAEETQKKLIEQLQSQ